MAVKTRENPFGIDAARDLHHQPAPPNVPFSNESVCFQGYDPELGLLFSHNLATVADDTSLWVGDFSLALPDGRLLMSKTFGRYETAMGMGDGALIMRCLEPLRTWRITFDGATFLTTQQENKQRFTGVDQYPVPTAFDIVWEGTAPMFETRRAGDGNLTTGYDVRYEQGGTFRGRLQYFDHELAISGPGYRAHSVGPLNLDRITGHRWAVATWPASSRVIGARTMHETGGRSAAAAYVVLDGELYPAILSEGPTWAPGCDEFDDREFDLVLFADGRRHHIHGEVLTAGYYGTCFGPSQRCAGMDPVRAPTDKHLVTRVATVRYTWDGEATHGLLEISRRLGED